MLRKLIMMLCLWGACQAGWAGKTFKAHVRKPGTLHEYLEQVSPAERRQITKMIISGELNSDDARVLREFAGYGSTQQRTRGNVTSLDLRKAEFVNGGSHYLDYNGRNYIGFTRNVIPAFLFRNCRLEEIMLPERLERIEQGAFEYSDLKRVVIPETVRYIGDYAFNGCWSLESVSLPPVLEYLGLWAFTDSDMLKTMEFGVVNRAANKAICRCTALREIIFKGRMGWHDILVEDCPELRNIDFQKGLDNPNKTNITSNCPKLTKVAVKKDKEPLEFYLY